MATVCTPECMGDEANAADLQGISRKGALKRQSNLGAALRRCLQQVASNSGHPLRRFMANDGKVPIVALFFDKRIRGEILTPDVPTRTCMGELIEAAQVTEGIDIGNPSTGGYCLNLSDISVPASNASDGSPPEATWTPALGSTCKAAVAVESSSELPDKAAMTATRARDFKNELQTKVCKILGRPVTKADIVFTVKKVCEQPPQFVATLDTLGQTFAGEPMPQKKAAEQSAASVALGAFSEERHGESSALHDGAQSNAEERTSSVQARGLSGLSQVDAVPQIDYKGQLLAWLQARGFQGSSGVNSVLSYNVDRCSEDEKAFQAKVILHALGDREFQGSPQLRDLHVSSMKAKRAAEHSAAQTALSALDAVEKGTPCTADVGRVQGSAERVCVLRLRSSYEDVPTIEELEIFSNDFLGAAARALQCSCAVPHPLQWTGDRPKGLCLYESGDFIEVSTLQNKRATALLKHSQVMGDAIFLDAKASFTSGAVLTDMTGARYELFKAEQSGAIVSPVVALNASRGMLIGGHPELPIFYDAMQWVGQDPRTVLNNILTRQRLPLPKFELSTQVSVAGADASMYCASTDVVMKDGAHIQIAGAPRDKKTDAHQDAALAALHAIMRHAAVSGDPLPTDHGLASTAWAEFEHQMEAASQETIGGTSALRYTISMVADGPAMENEKTPTAAHAKPLVVEECKNIRVVRGSHVLHPVIQLLAEHVPLHTPRSYSAVCEYEGIPCKLQLNLEVMERTDDRELDAAGDQGCEGDELLFEPPLRQQRWNFITQLLLQHKVGWAVDLGCGEGQLLEALWHAGLSRVTGVDHSEARIRRAQRRVEALSAKASIASQEQTMEVFLADLLKPDVRWSGADAVVLSEVLEHLPEVQFCHLAGAVLGIQAKLVVVTTPNAEFGAAAREETGEKCMRHSDHEREFTREQFREWAKTAAETYGYTLAAAQGVGKLNGHEAEGPCSQIAIFTRKAGNCSHSPEDTSEHHAVDISGTQIQADSSTKCCDGLHSEIANRAVDNFHSPSDQLDRLQRASCIFDEHAKINIDSIRESAILEIELVAGSGLRKFVVCKGSGEVPVQNSRITVHHATHLEDGKRLTASRRQGQRLEPFVFQLGGGHALEAWQRAVATMCKGEVAWISSPPAFAYGDSGAPPLIPAGEVLWFALELVDFKPPATMQSFKELALALEEGERQLERGRLDVKRQAFVQARQAFRRALDAVPPKLLLGHDAEDVTRYAALERTALLNQALCSQRLAERVEDNTAIAHWEDVSRVCTRLIDRHFQEKLSGGFVEIPRDMSMVVQALHTASSALGDTAWAAKAHFRRAVARQQLNYISDALTDLVTANRLMPEDSEISKRLETVRQQQQRVELKPAKMFTGILDRERSEREREEARAILEEKKRRRETRLQQDANRASFTLN